MNYFVTAIGTDSGKTFISAIITKALKADYWKPIQAGFPTDSEAIKRLLGETTTIHPERYVLNTPASPHMAAAIDKVEIKISDFELPRKESEHLVIEGAGGILVPINEKDYVIDLAQSMGCEVILVCDLYLGSINHSLLSINELKRRGLSLKGIVFNGDANPDSERIIEKVAGVPVLLRVAKEAEVTADTVEKYAVKLSKNL